jgi:hypothetical protein
MITDLRDYYSRPSAFSIQLLNRSLSSHCQTTMPCSIGLQYSAIHQWPQHYQALKWKAPWNEHKIFSGFCSMTNKTTNTYNRRYRMFIKPIRSKYLASSGEVWTRHMLYQLFHLHMSHHSTHFRTHYTNIYLAQIGVTCVKSRNISTFLAWWKLSNWSIDMKRRCSVGLTKEFQGHNKQT